ncbi:MAG: TonB-dependent receptor [Melioribacteraceae bacterium]|nr:TonB-dependent receptor [Melioribacteraceae bacterium]
MLQLFLILSFVFTQVTFAGETGKIAGTVLDTKTGEPLIGVNIILVSKLENGSEVKMSETYGAATDINGDYYILNIPPGSYSIKATYIGYTTSVQKDVKVSIDKTTLVDFGLSEKSFETDEVVITAYNELKIEIDQTSSKQSYTVPELESLAGVTNIQSILELQADVVDNHFRGGRTGESLYLVNGSSIVNPISNNSSFQPLTTGLQEVEVYTSGFSAEYGNAQSGIVNIVTKEGGNSWTTSFELTSNLPGYDTWGGSFYAPENMSFYAELKEPSEWLFNNNPENPGTNLGPFDRYLNFLSNSEDSLRIATFARNQWMQMVREVGWEYLNKPDVRFDFSVGGPIASKLRLFVAGRYKENYGIIPTPNPNREMQVMSNLVFKYDTSNKFKVNFNYYDKFVNKVNAGSFVDWAFDREIGIPKITENVYQIGLSWNHVFSNSAFGEISLDFLDTRSEERPDFLQEGLYRKESDSLAAYDILYADWYINNPSGFRVGDFNPFISYERSKTYNLKSTLTSQLSKNNLVKAGIQFTYYDLNVNNLAGLNTVAESKIERYSVFPYEGALFIQDKMEFEGMIANIGLRYDFYDFNYTYLSNIYSPLRNPNFDPSDPGSGPAQSEEYAEKDETSFFGKLQPRVGISFPITAESVVYLNYGVFIQRPPMKRILTTEVSGSGQVLQLGNPRLKPEQTIAYDIGLVQGLPFDIKLEISAYYKDVQDLIQQSIYFDKNFVPYYTFSNLDYANIKGFHISLEKRVGFFSSILRYNYQDASGKSATPFDNPISFYETATSSGQTIDLPDPEDVTLDFNRKHRVVANLRFQTPKDFGPEVFGTLPLSGFSASLTYKMMTGRPYTWDPDGKGLLFNKETRTENDMSLRIQKKFDFGKTNVTVYLEGFNILNEKHYSYSTYTNIIRLTKLERDGIESLEEASVDEESPYITSWRARIISNSPRSFRVGTVIKF